MPRLLSLTLICLTGLAVGAGVSFAQLEYTVTHPFALSTATTTRLFGMGGIASCLPDRGFANPAFAGQLTQWSAVARGSVTDFDSGLTLKNAQVSVAMPLRDNVDGLQITALHLRSNRFMAPGPVGFRVWENDVSIHYGRRISGPLLVGLAVSPVFQNSVEIINPIISTHFRSRAEWGGRIGIAYDLGGRGWVGATYDRYQEQVRLTVNGFPVPSYSSRAEEIVAGVSYQVSDHWLAALEWQQLSAHAGGADLTLAGWRGGIEGRYKDLSLRLGNDQESPTLGLGWKWRRFTFNYVYIGNWNRKVLVPSFGHSGTHSLEATCVF